MLGKLNAQQLFLPPACFDVGLGARYLISADFNNDGDLDIATSDWYGGTASVILGNGDGTFNTAHTYNVGTDPQSICTADFNSDGFLDLATANPFSNDISLLYGLGNGQFTIGPPITLDIPMWIISADFNNDGKADLAVALNNEGRIAILTGDGNGGFTIQKYSAGGKYPWRITSADFNVDGKMDLAISNMGDGLALLKGNGSGGFVTTDSFINIPINIHSLVIADINFDGKMDLVCSQDGMVYYKYIDTNVKFDIVNSPIFAAAQVNPNFNGICVEDFNEDGKLDIAASRQACDSIAMIIGTPGAPDSVFSIEAKNYYATCAHMPYGMLTADFNNDGHADLAASNEGGSNVSIFMNKLTAPNTILQQELELKSGGIVVYPNPASKVIMIKTAWTGKRELYDAAGVLQSDTMGDEMDISQFAKGVYFLKCGDSVRKVTID